MTDPGRGSAASAGPHLDLDALADVLAGERPDDVHLQRCASCADRLAELQVAEVAVVASLATLPDPVVPEGLADRLEAALRAEPPLEPARREPAGSVRRGPGTSTTVTTLPARRRTWLPAAAAAVALVLAGGLAWPALQGLGGGGDEAASTAAGGGAQDSDDEAGRVGAASAVRNDSGIDYADEAQRAAALPQVLAGTAGSPLALATEEGGGPGGGQRAEQDVEQGAATEESDSAASAGEAADPLDRLRDPAALEECLSALRAAGEEPLALDYARFDGAPALAVVLPGDSPDKLALFVVGAGCSAADERLLLFARPDRP